MNVLVTGGTGFIGSNLIPKLLLAGHKSVLLIRRTSDLSNLRSFTDSPLLKLYDVEREDLNDVLRLERVDVVIHLATLYRKQHDARDIDQMVETNIAFPTRLLEAMANQEVKYFINTGTFFEYRLDVSVSGGVNENSDIRPYNLYASTKASFENMLKYYVDKKGLSGLTLRLFAPYGMYDKPNKVIPLIIRSAIEDDVLELASNGYHKWDYVFAGDVSDAFLAAVDLILSGRIKYEAINVGSGSSLSLREIAELIESVLHRKLQINWGQKLEELNNVVADIQKARDILGWHPKTSLRDGLEITSNWIREMDGLSR